MTGFKLTYATMFDPPEELHLRYDAALNAVRENLGQEHAMYIDGKDAFSTGKMQDYSPINKNWLLAVTQQGEEEHARKSIAAARKAYLIWSKTPWQERVRLLRKTSDLIEERIFYLSAALSLEVGKNRMESLGDVQETIDLINYACDQMEENQGFLTEMGKDPLIGYEATNFSVMKPFGVWLVISPFNFPFALTGGPMGAALVTGNTVVVKPASDTAWIVRLLVDCFRDAGLPDGVVNFVTGPGRTLGNALINCDVDGVTFTGSFDVGTRIFQDFSQCNWIRPIILELGGKNAVIVSRHADLERAGLGIIRSAFGLQGQKCSAASRILVEEPIYDDLITKLKELTEKLVIGDPTSREVYLGPVINEGSYSEYKEYIKEIKAGGGSFITGGKVRTGGMYDHGWFCEPTLVEDLPTNHRLWKHEMFLPITTLTRVKDLNSAMDHANSVPYGLTAGIYGSDDEAKWFFDHIEAGVAYANRPQGATTGAWPGFQPFGGWKASGSSGKNAGGKYYLPLYMHEQIQTIVR